MTTTAHRASTAWKRLNRECLCGASLLLAIALGLSNGCITHPQNPAATQPATAVDLATTQPTYWLSQPPAAQVAGNDFDTVWQACKTTARDYLFALDRTDYRAGLITTVPLVSRQWFEPWRPDTGSVKQVFANSLGAIRRTLRFEVDRNLDQTYTITPKVLVEREAILERRVTDVSEYRLAFSGPGVRIVPREAVHLDPDTYQDVPIKYWYPIGRDTEMERQVARRLERKLQQPQLAGRSESAAPAPPPAAAATPLAPDGLVSDIGPNQTLFINVGAADKVVPGMTFEIYDGRATLPTLQSYAQVNPLSRGWVEVFAVGNGVSTCRIIQFTGNTPPTKGDQIFNFIFERGRPNHFALLGDFTNTDRATMADLIKRWGGVVDPAPTPDTTYAVLGTPPKDPSKVSAYDAARSQVEQLKIPTVTEDRLSLLIRYYDPSKR